MTLENTTVKVNAYRFAGHGRDDFSDALTDALRAKTVVDGKGNYYNIKELETRKGLLLGRIRRLQERDVPPIGTRMSDKEETLEDKGLAHRAYFLVDQEEAVLLWLSSHNSCGPAWLTKIAAAHGCRLTLAIHLDSSALDRVRKSKDAITQFRVALGTAKSEDLGLDLTDDLMRRAEDMEADIVELTLKVRQEKDGVRTLSKVWKLIDGLLKGRETKKADVRSLKVEMFDEDVGDFVARDLIRERSHVELESPVAVQQLSTSMAFGLLMEAHKELVRNE